MDLSSYADKFIWYAAHFYGWNILFYIYVIPMA